VIIETADDIFDPADLFQFERNEPCREDIKTKKRELLSTLLAISAILLLRFLQTVLEIHASESPDHTSDFALLLSILLRSWD
jgi:hypothetical protein